MRTVFNKLSNHALLRAFVYIILGLLMIIIPQTILHIIVYILAAYIAILGIINIVNFFRCRECSNVGFDLVSGILMVVIGILMVVFATQLVSIMPIFLGILLIISAAANLVQVINYGRMIGKTNFLLVILNLLVIAGGIIVMVNPFSSAVLLLQIFGGITILSGIAEIIAFFLYRKIGKDTE